jgi:hypothetical protein
VPNEVARRVAPRVGAGGAAHQPWAVLPAHRLHRARPHPDPDVHGPRRDLCASLSSIGFRRIAFLNGHYDNTYAIAYACANAADRLARARRVPGQLLGRHDRGRGGRVRLHANRGETSAVMAINPTSSTSTTRTPRCRSSRSRARHPCTPRSSSRPGLGAPRDALGNVGRRRESSAEYGERYLESRPRRRSDARRHRSHVRRDAGPLALRGDPRRPPRRPR